jgi:hypothetical protein
MGLEFGSFAVVGEGRKRRLGGITPMRFRRNTPNEIGVTLAAGTAQF